MILDLLGVFLGGGCLLGKCIKETHEKNRAEANPHWYSSKNYNTDLQRKYCTMLVFEQEKLEEMLGHKIKIACIQDKKNVLTELLAKDGYDYYDSYEATKEWERATGRRPRKW